MEQKLFDISTNPPQTTGKNQPPDYKLDPFIETRNPGNGYLPFGLGKNSHFCQGD